MASELPPSSKPLRLTPGDTPPETAAEIVSETAPLGRYSLFANLLIFCLSFVLWQAVTRQPPPAPGRIEKKLQRLDQRGAVDLIFVGSSRTHFQFVPDAFDAEADRLGMDIDSFNFGLPGAKGHEIDYLIDRYVARVPGLKYVFIEAREFEYQTPDYNERTFREIYWHDLRRTIDAVQTSVRGPLGPGLGWAEAQDHLLHFALRFANLWPSDPEPANTIDEDGYEAWTRAYEAAGKDKAEAVVAGDLYVNADVIRRQALALGKKDIGVYYVVPPHAASTPVLHRLHDEGVLRGVFVMNDPRAYPEFLGWAEDKVYLAPPRARLYSEALAREFHQAVSKADETASR